MRSGENCKILAIWSIHRHRSFLSAVCMGVIHSCVFFFRLTSTLSRQTSRRETRGLAVRMTSADAHRPSVEQCLADCFFNTMKEVSRGKVRSGGTGVMVRVSKNECRRLGSEFHKKLRGGHGGIEIPTCWSQPIPALQPLKNPLN